MKDLYKGYPDYITRFNSEMFMLLDPFHEKMNDRYGTFSHEIDVYNKMSIIQYSKLFLDSLFINIYYIDYKILIILALPLSDEFPNPDFPNIPFPEANI